MTRKRICIIGAGASGLITASKALKSGEFDITVVEQRNEIGGGWVYQPNPPNQQNEIITREFPVIFDPEDVPSAMYPSLHTNLPGKLMQFRSFEFGLSDQEMYPSRKRVLQYLVDVAFENKLFDLILFSTVVLRVEKCENEWKVTLLDFMTKNEKVCYFDAVVVGNGHFTEPSIPNLEGIENFSGTVSHSVTYRHPKDYKDKTVMVVGASYSGQDITRELSQEAEHVYVSVKDVGKAKLQKTTNLSRVTIVPAIRRFQGDQVILEDGQVVTVLNVIFATGYLYRFPFFEPEFEKKLTDSVQVNGLFLHLVYRDDPTLFFIGLPRMVVPFHLFEYQAEYLVELLLGNHSLPDLQTMIDIEESGGIGAAPSTIGEKAHVFGQDREFEYCDYLAEQFGGLKVPEWRKQMRRDNPHLRLEFLGY